MTEEQRRRRVTHSQLETLWEHLRLNQGLATGRNKSAQAREYSRRMWVDVAQSLNALGEGATKDWKGWSKYWNDYKAKLKAKKAAIDASHRRTGGGPTEVPELTTIEKNFISLLGEGFGSGIPGARISPQGLAPTTPNSAIVQPISVPTASPLPLDLALPSHVPVHVSVMMVASPHNVPPSPSSVSLPPPPPLPIPILRSPQSHHIPTPLLSISTLPSTPDIPVTSVTPTGVSQTLNHISQTTRPRTRRRRNTPRITSEESRTAILGIAQERVDVLKDLVSEIREIKELLRTFVIPRDE